jgi:predicted site-specific integrase-resolvase
LGSPLVFYPWLQCTAKQRIKPPSLLPNHHPSAKQKQDLIRQIEALERFCLARGYIIDEVIEEIGGGLNYTRPQFLRLMAMIENQQIGILVIAFKDRLCRFGFEYFEHFLKSHEGKLIVANTQTWSPQQELIEDLMAVIHSFSCRLYGLRKYKKEINKILKETEDEENLGSSLPFMLNQQTRCQDNILLTQKFRKFLKP